MDRMIKLIRRIKNMVWNVCVSLVGLVIHRDKKVVLFGCWMGTKFADNPRYLFQFLSVNREVLGLRHVIWVTRDLRVNKMLKKCGYESYLCGTKESAYWHLKAGVHFLNNVISSETYDADIDTKYSWGAVKFQLWHGVGMKSVGALANENKGRAGILHDMKKNKLLNKITSVGGWKEPFTLATCQKQKRGLRLMAECHEDCMFISGYPRNCECLQRMTEEEKVIEQIKEYSGSVLYLPTFRSNYEHYKHPLLDEGIRNYISQNHILWIEKPHTVSDFKLDDFLGVENTLILAATFDINTIYQYITVMISDYSSAVFDAAYRNIPVIMYTPDLDDFKNGNVGFSIDVKNYCAPLISMNLFNCYDVLTEVFEGRYFTKERNKVLGNIRKDFWENREYSYEQIWRDLKFIIDNNSTVGLSSVKGMKIF